MTLHSISPPLALAAMLIGMTVAFVQPLPTPAFGQARPGPVEDFKSRIRRAVAIRYDPALQAPGMAETQKQLIWDLIDAAFDETLITPSILADTWPRLNATQRVELGPLMSWAIKWKFIGKLYKYNVREVTFADGRIENGRYLLNALVTGKWLSHPARFVFHPRQGGWVATDVVLRGTSLVAHYRRKFDGTCASRGFRGLIEHVNTEVAEEFEEMGYRPSGTANSGPP